MFDCLQQPTTRKHALAYTYSSHMGNEYVILAAFSFAFKEVWFSDKLAYSVGKFQNVYSDMCEIKERTNSKNTFNTF